MADKSNAVRNLYYAANYIILFTASKKVSYWPGFKRGSSTIRGGKHRWKTTILVYLVEVQCEWTGKELQILNIPILSTNNASFSNWFYKFRFCKQFGIERYKAGWEIKV